MNDHTIMSTGSSPARLVVRQGTQAGQEFSLTQDAAVLGREADLDISIQDPEMSRRHARVIWQHGDYVLEDLGSTNGTTLNGVQIREPRALHTGDSIGVGQTVLEFLWQEAAAPPPQPPVYVPPMPEPPTFHAPPTMPDPGPVAAPGKKKKSNCLMYGCGCLILLVLVAAIALVLVVILIPDQLQPILNDFGVPVDLIGSSIAPGLLVG